MKKYFKLQLLGLLALLSLPITIFAACPPDSVQSGPSCVDKYEASVWKINPSNINVIHRVKNGTATLAILNAVGAVQIGLSPGDYVANGCPFTGAGCVDVYAVSIPGVYPSDHISYFQAIAAARNSEKRLLTNSEWQTAALGTVDGSPCAVSTLSLTGSAPGCVSDIGAFDMVGNIHEMVAEWFTPQSVPDCPGIGGWGSFSDDHLCYSGAYSLLRGGGFTGGASGTGAGVFASDNAYLPGNSDGNDNVGFRSIR